jgi:hypothetical protein
MPPLPTSPRTPVLIVKSIASCSKRKLLPEINVPFLGGRMKKMIYDLFYVITKLQMNRPLSFHPYLNVPFRNVLMRGGECNSMSVGI